MMKVFKTKKRSFFSFFKTMGACNNSALPKDAGEKAEKTLNDIESAVNSFDTLTLEKCSSLYNQLLQIKSSNKSSSFEERIERLEEKITSSASRLDNSFSI